MVSNIKYFDTDIPDPTPEVLSKVGLKLDEYETLVKRIGRKPNLVELGIVGALWSEHCGYKSSKIHLKKLPTKGEQILQGPGENAGVVRISDDIAVAFKIESHNHPSAVEPFQGAATGVGGILRDIFAMGARPIAILDSLRFGEIRPDYTEDKLQLARTKYIFDGVIAGIAHYGNCMGVPTVGGEVIFDDAYSTNPLVNVFCLGVVKPEEMIKGFASGEGNPVIYVGAKTGRDGIQGATFASVDLADNAVEDRPAVQVGDPFTEKLLLEATLEIGQMPGLIGVQDMGAAGLTSSTAEMAARAGMGIELNLDKVPQRAADMTAYEMMLSESQERMVVVVQKGYEESFMKIFHKWGLDAVVAGYVIPEKVLRVLHKGRVVADLDNLLLVDDAPLYNRPMVEPKYYKDAKKLEINQVEEALKNKGINPSDILDIGYRLITLPSICSKRQVWQQYDYMVRTNTMLGPDYSDAAVIRFKGHKSAVAMTTDCQGKYCYLNARLGAKLAVYEAARNVIASGGKPLAITNCLNFGSPEDSEVMWTIAQACEGMSEACLDLGTPVTGGNVSLYNRTTKAAILPTPVIGMVGAIENTNQVLSNYFQSNYELIYVLGCSSDNLSGSSLAWDLADIRSGLIETDDVVWSHGYGKMLRELAPNGKITACHDISDGGLFVALTEMSCGAYAINRKELGVHVSLTSEKHIFCDLFSEFGHRWIVTIKPEYRAEFEAEIEQRNLKSTFIGNVSEGQFEISINKKKFEFNVIELYNKYETSLSNILNLKQ